MFDYSSPRPRGEEQSEESCGRGDRPTTDRAPAFHGRHGAWSEPAPRRIARTVGGAGGLERPLLDALLDAGLPAAVVHPGRGRQVANGPGPLAKTDAIDARVLARFTQLAAPRLAEKRPAHAAELAAWVACRRQLTVTRARQSNRRGATASKAALKAIDAVLKTPDQQVDSLDRQIRDLIDADDDFKHLDGLLQSVPGVGPTLSATLAAELSERGRADRRRVASLVGIAPFDRDSGRCQAKRSIRGGRTAVRRVPYMATLAATRFNPLIRVFADRLKGRRQNRQGRRRRLHAKTPGLPQRHGPRRPHLGPTRRREKTRNHPLTSNTVAPWLPSPPSTQRP